MRFRISQLASPLLTLWLCSCASAQLTISEPEPTKGPIRQVSSTLPFSTATPWDGIARARHDDASSGTQIRVSVQYLLVDEATRTEIYADLPSTAIKTSVLVPGASQSQDLWANQSPIRSAQQINAPARVTSCVLDETQTSAIMRKALDSASSDILRSPSVMLLDGKQAEMNDVVQRPFIVDMQQEDGLLQPVTQVIDEGTRLRLLAIVTGATESTPPASSEQSIRLSSELVVSRILDVKAEPVFGLTDEPPTVQIPVHQVTSAIASERLAQGQTLLVDPHVIKTKSVRLETAVPVLAKIPYVGRTFTNTAVSHVDQHMLMLLRPSIENVEQ